MTSIVVVDPRTKVVTPRAATPVVVVSPTTPPVKITSGTPGPRGPQGIQGIEGPPGGPTVVAVPYADWPPTNPQPDTLYLRLAP